jgi:hypothetical protein
MESIIVQEIIHTQKGAPDIGEMKTASILLNVGEHRVQTMKLCGDLGHGIVGTPSNQTQQCPQVSCDA